MTIHTKVESTETDSEMLMSSAIALATAQLGCLALAKRWACSGGVEESHEQILAKGMNGDLICRFAVKVTDSSAATVKQEVD